MGRIGAPPGRPNGGTTGEVCAAGAGAPGLDGIGGGASEAATGAAVGLTEGAAGAGLAKGGAKGAAMGG